ncbi:MAG TPA: metal-dependent hydrolase [Acidimicrobiales bacterium]|nr:metal-dependent hydrolase [Acidimicrobiales bacterium]
MLLWFAGLSVLLVWQVFHDPRIDYRLVVVGALLPDVVDGVLGGARVLHSLSFSVALLGVVMLVRRRPLRRRLLAVPIGTFLHLVLDGMWARTDVFWWPFTGWSFGDSALPSFDRSPLLVAAMEVAGLAALWWFAGVREAEDRVP